MCFHFTGHYTVVYDIDLVLGCIFVSPIYLGKFIFGTVDKVKLLKYIYIRFLQYIITVKKIAKGRTKYILRLGRGYHEKEQMLQKI